MPGMLSFIKNPFMAVQACLALGASVWYFFHGSHNLAAYTFCLALGDAVLSVTSQH